MLDACERFVLDNCKLDYEVLAGIREDFREGPKVVWRVYFGKDGRYNTLTDDDVIRCVENTWKWFGEKQIIMPAKITTDMSSLKHGMNTKTNYVFNLKTGKLLTEEDLFGKDFERKIQKRLTEKANILRQQDMLPEEDIFYSNSNITPNGNFAITDTSIIYTFNPYEIAPYVYGIIDIEITKN